MVLVHGYHGRGQEMRNYHNILSNLIAKCHCVSCFLDTQSNKLSIKELGIELAVKVKNIIESNKSKGHQFTKLSFIGHSLGGVVIRAAIPHLDRHRTLMHTLLTLGSPHLGLLTHKSLLT